jgi:membrane associated rhomboid family serine protease
MDKAWIKIITITRSVGVMGLLLSTLMMYLFSSEIVNLLGSQKLFYIIVIILCIIAVGLVFAILKPKQPEKSPSSSVAPKKDVKVTYDHGSKHNGNNNF